MEIQQARVRDDDAPEGFRVLCDRLWPRGLSKQKAALDLWAKELGPSTELRKWYHGDKDGRHDEFEQRYTAELDALDLDDGPVAEALAAMKGHQVLVLLTDVKQVDQSELPALQRWLGKHLR